MVCFVILFAVDYPPPPPDQHRQAPAVQPGELRLNHWLLRRLPNKSSLNWQTTLSSKSWDRSWLWLSRQWIVSKTLVAILRKWVPTSQGRKSSGWYLFSVEVHSEVGTYFLSFTTVSLDLTNIYFTERGLITRQILKTFSHMYLSYFIGYNIWKRTRGLAWSFWPMCNLKVWS